MSNEVLVLSLSCVQLFATPWTVAHQLLCPWNVPGKNTGVGCHFILQGIFPTQGSNPDLLHLLHCRWILYLLSYGESPSLFVNKGKVFFYGLRPGWGKQAGTPVRSQPRGLWVPLQWKRCRGALGRGHPLGKETPEEQPGHRGAWEAPNSEESPRGKALNFQERVFPLKKKF